MPSPRSLESNKLEIELVAGGILVLVLVLGVLLLLGVGFKAPGREHDAEHCQGSPRRTTAQKGAQEDQWGSHYRDEEDETLFTNFRRRSQSIAEELRLELIGISRALSISGSSSTEQHPNGLGLINKVRGLSLDNAIVSWKKSDPEVICQESSEVEHSPISVTGREDNATELQKRSSKGRNEAIHDLEAQESGGSLL